MLTPTPEPKPVLITGCSSGIGHCLARGLGRCGYRVFATARRAADVAALADMGLESMPLDLDSSASIAWAVAAVRERTAGRLYALINNGAYGQPGAVEDLTRDTLRAQFETNVFGTHELTNLCLPLLRSNGGGRIVQISSILGLVCLPYRGAYNASKYALEALSDTLRLELRGSPIHVALVEPGPIRGRFRANAYAAFQARIDVARSRHQAAYAATAKRLTAGEVPFTLPPEAVLKKVIHALESPHPRARYRVTPPAHLFANLKRLLPDAWMDRFLAGTQRGKQR